MSVKGLIHTQSPQNLIQINARRLAPRLCAFVVNCTRREGERRLSGRCRFIGLSLVAVFPNGRQPPKRGSVHRPAHARG